MEKLYFTTTQDIAMDMLREGFEEKKIDEVTADLDEKLQLDAIAGTLILGDIIIISEEIMQSWKDSYGVQAKEIDLYRFFNKEKLFKDTEDNRPSIKDSKEYKELFKKEKALVEPKTKALVEPEKRYLSDEYGDEIPMVHVDVPNLPDLSKYFRK